MVKVNIVGRHMEVTKDLKTLVERKTNRLTRLFDRFQRFDVILNYDGKVYRIEIIIKGPRHQNFIARLSDHNPFKALEVVIDKMERQLTKFKEKSRKHHSKLIRNNKNIMLI